ncbi:MAG TPA: ATP-binding protein, partial [Chitinispirillaceae bacterium]|nr:ATP-binding protein [Chitinispirillaceae bacterium]
MDDRQIHEMRPEFSEFTKELLNLSVGQSIVELEKTFGDLTFNPSTVVYGELDFPKFLSGYVVLESRIGAVLCGFSLNLANLRIGQKLEEALVEIEKKTAEALEAKKNISSILELLPIGLIAIDRFGKILPGYSKSMNVVAGVENNVSLIGRSLTDLLKIDEVTGGTWKNWLSLVFTKFNKIPFRDLQELCEINEVITADKRVLKFEWYPVIDTAHQVLEKLLVVVENMTQQRDLERRMKELNCKHQENLDMISQIINIGPEEVTDFIYDSSQLLADAQKIVEGESHDREFVNDLFRTFHTLKGSSGQFKFTVLQEMAHKVEDHLRRYRNARCDVDDGIITEVKTSIQDAKNYITRISDIRAKLGGKNETLHQKAHRDPDTIMVSIEEIDGVKNKFKTLLGKAKNFINDAYFINEVVQCLDAVCELKRMKLSFFLSSLGSLAHNIGEKTGKKVSLSITNDISIEIDIIRVIHQCFIHLINNAIDHGIELPQDRVKAGKIENGVIELSGKKENESYVISIEDDGNGVDFAAVKNSIKSLFDFQDDDIEKLDNEDLLKYLFKPGFTTRPTASMLSGRGVGLDFVYHILKKLGGDVKIKSTKGRGTIVMLIVPIPEN